MSWGAESYQHNTQRLVKSAPALTEKHLAAKEEEHKPHNRSRLVRVWWELRT